MQSSPPEHPDTSPTAPSTERDRDEAKYTERDHDNMKPQDRFSYIDAERRGHFMAGLISAGCVRRGPSGTRGCDTAAADVVRHGSCNGGQASVDEVGRKGGSMPKPKAIETEDKDLPLRDDTFIKTSASRRAGRV